MELSGYLAEFSLPEIFQFLEQGQKKGLLTIRALPAAQNQQVQGHYIWLLHGRIVAAADRLDNKGLISMIAQRRWVNDDVISTIHQICPPNTALGPCLKSQGLLQAEQLNLLFRTQVVKQVTALFQLRNGQFEFDSNATLPQPEITGLILPATEATLIGLRTLQDWTALAEKLPDPFSGLSRVNTNQLQPKLDSLELQILGLASGNISLQKIADRLELSVEKVKQIAFRLIVANLAEEVFIVAAEPPPRVAADTRVADRLLEPMVIPSSKTNGNQLLTSSLAVSSRVTENLPEPKINSSSKINVSPSFLQNLVGFLRGKA